MPSESRPSAVQTVTNLTLRVLADPSGCLPARPASSAFLIGMPVPSTLRYIVGAEAGSGLPCGPFGDAFGVRQVDLTGAAAISKDAVPVVPSARPAWM